MTKLLAMTFISAILMLGLSGCGYKAPPFYEKPVSDKGSNVAL